MLRDEVVLVAMDIYDVIERQQIKLTLLKLQFHPTHETRFLLCSECKETLDGAAYRILPMRYPLACMVSKVNRNDVLKDYKYNVLTLYLCRMIFCR